MKKIKAILTMAAAIITVLYSLTCYSHAKLLDKEFSAEQLYIGDPIESATNLYGPPEQNIESTNPSEQPLKIYNTPNGKIKIRGSYNPSGTITISEIRIEGDSNCKTYSRVGIGTLLTDVRSIYGKPTYEAKNDDTTDGSTQYILTYHKTSNRKLKQIIFTGDRSRVTSIKIFET